MEGLMHHHPGRVILVAAVALIGASLACGPRTAPAVPQVTPTSPPPTPESVVDAPTEQPTEQPTEGRGGAEVEPTEEPAVEEPTTPEDTAGDAWLVFSTTTGSAGEDVHIWAASADGEVLRDLYASGFPIAPYQFGTAVAPMGGAVAFISQSGNLWQDLTLNLIRLSEGTVTPVTPLTGPESDLPPDWQPGDRAEAQYAISSQRSLAWSPDSQTLAFVGAADGPSADLYTYTPATGAILRLTDGPSQTYGPNWSPDGKYIVHFGVDSFGTGAGYTMSGAWAAAADGSSVISYALPENTSAEEFVGWLDDDTFISNSWHAGCDKFRLRAVDLLSGAERVLWNTSFSSIAMADDGTLLVVLPDDMATHSEFCGRPTAAGWYIIDPESGSAYRAQEGADFSDRVTWSAGAGQFFVRTETATFSVSLDSIVNELAAPGSLDVKASPDGQWWAWGGSGYLSDTEGLWLGRAGQTADQVYDGRVRGFTWAPDGRSVFFFSGSTLYAAQLADGTFTVKPVGEFGGTVDPSGFAWTE